MEGTWRTLAATDHLARSKFSVSCAGSRGTGLWRDQGDGRTDFTGFDAAVIADRPLGPRRQRRPRGRVQQVERVEDGDDGRVQTPLLAVGHLDRDADAVAANADRLD